MSDPLDVRLATDYGELVVESYSAIADVVGLWHEGYDLHFAARTQGRWLEEADERSIMGVLRQVHDRLGPVQPEPEPASLRDLITSAIVEDLTFAGPDEIRALLMGTR